MKIGMTETSAMEGFFKNWTGEREEGVRFFRSAMALLGAEFREEPRPPARLGVGVADGGVAWLLILEDIGHPDLTPLGIMAGAETGRRVRQALLDDYREAAARYNAVERLLGHYGKSYTLLHEFLAEERERLQ